MTATRHVTRALVGHTGVCGGLSGQWKQQGWDRVEGRTCGPRHQEELITATVTGTVVPNCACKNGNIHDPDTHLLCGPM